jgi:hypothetical protein
VRALAARSRSKRATEFQDSRPRFATHDAVEAMTSYRNRFRPSATLAHPHAILGVAAVCADTQAEADRLATTIDRASAHPVVLSGDKTAHDAAEATLLRSLELAKRQDAKAWELRTATSLALLYLRSCRSREARAVLEPTLSYFKQGHDTRDFQVAIGVLSALSS